MFVQKIVYLYPILCISLSSLSCVIGDDAFRNNYNTDQHSASQLFDKEAGSDSASDFIKPTFSGHNSKENENHKDLAEDVLRYYMTAYFSTYKAGFSGQNVII